MIVQVDGKALHEVLQALIGDPHRIRELQATSYLRGEECPIKKLCSEYDAAAKQKNET